MNDSENFVVKFERKPTKKGRYYYFNIPIQFIHSEIINPNFTYEIRVFIQKKEISQALDIDLE